MKLDIWLASFRVFVHKYIKFDVSCDASHLSRDVCCMTCIASVTCPFKMNCLRVRTIVQSRFNLTPLLLSGSNSGDASDADSSSSGGSCEGLDDDESSAGGGGAAAAVAAAVGGHARSAAAAPAAAAGAAAAAGGKLEGGSLKSRLKGKSDAAKKVRGLLIDASYATMVSNRLCPGLCAVVFTFVCRRG